MPEDSGGDHFFEMRKTDTGVIEYVSLDILKVAALLLCAGSALTIPAPALSGTCEGMRLRAHA
jgi:hypothetical protein